MNKIPEKKFSIVMRRGKHNSKVFKVIIYKIKYKI